jgi:glycerophosphoryl diester phosphodiesterase
MRRRSSRFALLVAIAAMSAACGPSESRDAPESKEGAKPLHGGPMQLIAHRGASGLAPEHTRASFDLAVEIGVDYLEQDLQQTSDGVLIVLHDDTLDRTARGPAANCRGPVRDKTLAQLETCDFGAWFDEKDPTRAAEFQGQGILTLDALISRYGDGVRYYIETKNPEEAEGMEASLIATLSDRGLLDASGDPPPVYLQSFSSESLRDLAEHAPAIPRLLLLDRDVLPDSPDARLAEIARYANGIGPHYSDVDAALVAAAHRHGLVVHSYTVNDASEMRRLEALGVDAIFSDFPDRYRALQAPTREDADSKAR